MLLLPTLWIGFAVQDPTTNYAVFAAIALLCGLGAGNFSSSMANISFFYPKRLQGTALGANAGVGNLGVGLAQLIAPIAMYGGALLILGGSAQTRVDQGATMQIWVQNAGFIWVPLIVAVRGRRVVRHGQHRHACAPASPSRWRSSGTSSSGG